VLGVKLFERDRRRVLITSAGEDLVARARRVLLELDDLVAASTRIGDPLTGVLRIGVIPTIAPYLLPDVTPAIRARFPRLRLSFREAKTEEVLDALHDGRLDAGLIALVPEAAAYTHADVLRDPFVLAMPPAHRLTRKRSVGLADLDGESVLLLDDGHCFRTQALALCAQSGAVEADFRATSMATLVQMVAAGTGVTLLPRLAVDVENRRAQLEVRPFTAPAPSRTIALVWRPGSPVGAAFLEIAGVMRKAQRVTRV
jgi:LysR family hydrogen peroxide-inducible transcriptional activator